MLVETLKLLRIMFVITEFVNDKLNISNSVKYIDKTN